MTKIYLLLALWACLITACVSPIVQSPVVQSQSDVPVTASPTVKVNPTKHVDATEFLTFAETFSNLPVDMQKLVFLETNQALIINQNDLLHRMKLVMIYGLPSSNLQDTVKAQQLLQKILQEDILANSQLAFANLLFDYLAMVNKPTKNTNGEPKRADNLQQKNEALQLKLDATQQKLEAAQQKLDDLRKIEKSMGEREAMPNKNEISPKK